MPSQSLPSSYSRSSDISFSSSHSPSSLTPYFPPSVTATSNTRPISASFGQSSQATPFSQVHPASTLSSGISSHKPEQIFHIPAKRLEFSSSRKRKQCVCRIEKSLNPSNVASKHLSPTVCNLLQLLVPKTIATFKVDVLTAPASLGSSIFSAVACRSFSKPNTSKIQLCPSIIIH